MKKVYMTPLVTIEKLTIENMIATSITGVDGNTGITKGNDAEAPETADARDRFDYDMAVDAEPQYGDLWQ